MSETKNIALLIDADNSPARSVQKIFSELARHGKVNIRKAYGNWTSSNLKGWEAVLRHPRDPAHSAVRSYEGQQCQPDLAMAIDAMDILYTKKQVDAFCIVSSDCDFTLLGDAHPVGWKIGHRLW